MGLKSKVRTHTVTTNATLTTRGREILSREGKIDVTKFILSDEEIDYTLWDNKHLMVLNIMEEYLKIHLC